MAYTTRIAGGAAVLAAAGLLGTGLTGCSGSVKVETKTTPSVSATDLQAKLAEQFAGSDTKPKSITCPDELVGEVGKKATCDVVISDTNAVQAVVTVTKVDGTDVAFDITPSLSKEQLQKSVAGMGVPGTITCDSGLDGTVGATAKCQSAAADGAVVKTVAEVDDVNGLQMDVSVKRLLPREDVQRVLMQKLNADGTPVETVECVDDVVGKAGADVECAAVTGNQKQGYVVTVTTVEENTFDIDYKNAP